MDADEIEALKAEIKKLETEHDRLVTQIVALEHPHGHSMAEFMRVVGDARGGHLWGWRKDLMCATQGTGHPVTETLLDKWKRRDNVPDWAFEVATLTFKRDKVE